MRFFNLSLFAAMLLFGLMLNTVTAANEKKNIKPTQHWGGIVNEIAKRTAAPKDGFLTTQESSKKLWTEWGLKGDVPKIDFKKQIVFVQLASGPNNLGTSYTLDDKGNLTSLSRQTLKAGSGFGYGIDVLDRAGIKTYKGKQLP
ncbi:MAG: hypothetical protein EXR98_14060 [Gemmataceae bacterium]|nr:hypothetical protein [Gemmataceae bacterium]